MHPSSGPPPVSEGDPAADAREAVELAHAEPARAWVLATQVMGHSGAGAEALSLAHEALGLVAKESDDLDGSVAALTEAVTLAERAGLTHRAAQARVSLAFALQSRGEPERALRELDRAARELQHSHEGARVQMRRGSILQRLGKLDDAIAAYEQALPTLRRAGDRLWEARLLSNRGVVLTSLSAFGAAERDLRRAVELHDELGQRLAAAQTRHNLGFLASRRGDVPNAFAWYDEADEAFGAFGRVDWVGMADRCELLLSTRLIPEARQLASRAVAALADAGVASDLAEARLTLANAALLDGDHHTARHEADQAHGEFLRQDRPRWAILARNVVLRATWMGGDRSLELQQTALRTGTELASAGWDVPALDSRLIAARVALSRGDLVGAERALAGASSATRRGPVELRARAWYAEALLRLAHGDTRGADSALRAGTQALHRHRATLGSTELRVHVAGYAGELATLGLRLAVDAKNPVRVLRWAERWRAGTLFLRPVRPPRDEGLTAELAELRAVVAQIDQAALGGTDTRPLLRRQAAIERSVQARARQTPGDHGLGASASLDLDGLVDALGDRALIEIVAIGEDLHAVAIAGGRVSLEPLGPSGDIAGELQWLLFALHRLARPGANERSRDAATQAAAFSARRLDDLLLAPVRPVIGDRPIVAVPSGPLHALPWSALPSCRGRTVTVAPSAQLWLQRHAQTTGRMADRHVVLVSSDELPHAAQEVRALHSHYPSSRVLLGDDATVEAVTAALDGAKLAHLACHGRFRADNPLFSCLQLADGPLTVYDLEGLDRAPELLLLSACDSGLSSVKPGDELMGLSSALFSLGTATLIASVAPVPDQETRSFMVALHGHLRGGDSPACALARARADVSDAADGALSTAAFVCFGAG